MRNASKALQGHGVWFRCAGLGLKFQDGERYMHKGGRFLARVGLVDVRDDREIVLKSRQLESGLFFVSVA